MNTTKNGDQKQFSFLVERPVPTWPDETSTPVHRLREVGPLALSDVELVSLVAGMNRPEQLQQIRDLLIDAGGLAKLQGHSLNALTQALGTEKRAERLRAALELARRMILEGQGNRPVIRSPADVAALLMVEMGHLEQEQLRVLILNNRHEVVRHVIVYQGNICTTLVRVGEVFREAVRDNAAAIIVAHNHPSGSCEVSPQDTAVTKDIVAAGKLLDIETLDHIVVGRGKWVSMRERGLGFSS